MPILSGRNWVQLTPLSQMPLQISSLTFQLPFNTKVRQSCVTKDCLIKKKPLLIGDYLS